MTKTLLVLINQNENKTDFIRSQWWLTREFRKRELRPCIVPKKELLNEFEIHYPIIDDPEAPTYDMWKRLFAKEFKTIVQPAILIGHSLGGSMLLKYISEEKPKILISSLFLVSIPHWGKNGQDVEDFVLQENFEPEFGEIGKVFLYHCKEDSIVPFKHMNFYKKAFPNAIVKILNGENYAFSGGL